MSVKELEKIALDSQNGHESKIEYLDSASIKLYSSEMGIPLRKVIKMMKRYFPKPIICADIGGNVGTAAYGINRMRGVESFCIDIILKINPRRLPRERHIVADVNNMPHIPDDSFHVIVSYNSLLSPSPCFKEIYRILRPGGYAFIDLESPFYKPRDGITKLDMGSAIQVYCSFTGGYMSLPGLLESIDGVENLKKLMEEGNLNRNPLLQNPDIKQKMVGVIGAIEDKFYYDKINYVYRLHKPVNQSSRPI